ncbi:MAG: hypothetical protein E6I65_00435 [Chloroflexi bacterium]|nr:MAG: hypothetical protein E6I65_00435 [Chloroflexota bacterium]
MARRRRREARPGAPRARRCPSRCRTAPCAPRPRAIPGSAPRTHPPRAARRRQPHWPRRRSAGPQPGRSRSGRARR